MNRKISVIGLGYVGLPVAVAFGEKAKVIGYDINKKRIDELRKSHDNTGEIEPGNLKNTNIHFTTDPNELRQADFHIVAVPTPINKANQPDLTQLLSATKTVGKVIKSGDIIVYESTVYPGCTEEECVPILEKQSGLKYIKNILRTSKKSMSIKGFFLGYSPERINPGDKEHTFTKIKKIVSASTPEALEIVAETYSSVVNAGVHCVSSIEVAEAAKVIENTQRDLNIAFINELSLIFNSLGIDTHEVLEAAETKWNFIPFRPGLVGGHCIGVDPYYLTYRAEQAGLHPRIILAGREINDGMGEFVAQQTMKTMATAKIGTVGARVTVFGLTFKEDCPDLRNSKVPKILAELKKFGCELQGHDPICNPLEAFNEFGVSLSVEEDLLNSHAIILAVAHKSYREWSVSKWEKLLKSNGVIIDIKNVLPTQQLESAGHLVWKL